ncbi:bifunctional 2-polyprenyl-6-hydroxyphenol methylase/3-demethylubiquinol 3-O-methyltransferase UbiG [Patulibacter sp.]|uniref:class I SAM-dependent methyltransferase n=1 Tax=Patulibacter sp. TaxID=1912859 RepID=UPI002715632B|nr:class I SAM-dependent methyltransferase [Patulibacter sp.]MDO9408608.1 class I SAM-dependent methyltransferase [Patulibacter sp.]
MPLPEDPELRRIARFWDARAREDARRYSVPGGARVGEATFEGAGEAVLSALEATLGWSAEGAAVALDLGCGAGRLTPALAARADQVVAVDVAPGMLDAARQRVGSTDAVSYLHADAGEVTGLPAAWVDVALVLGVLPHLPTVKLVAAVLHELGRLLAPGGSAVFDVRSADPALVLPGEDDLPAHVAGHPLWRGTIVDLETLAALAHQAELVVERIEGSGTARCLVLVRREEH